jgi:methanethiol S-methyltransferase
MFKRVAFFAYGTLSYLIFFGTFLYAIGFVGNFGVPTTLDGSGRRPAIVITRESESSV